ncbi:hypothetical protein C2G38_412048 [Gigaspora rosea]|uniref:Mutator-like transposase domain-containing protein n=1 Tax=Gigaspora rosea TaxID=44941 RepID=A0A397VT83_9GLOM|nr:hypothetical protein C2G38_412048 [Gigaspora rosea]
MKFYFNGLILLKIPILLNFKFVNHIQIISRVFMHILKKIYSYTGRISVPYILGLTCTENIKWLRGFVANTYDIFNDFKVQYLANKKLNTLIKSGKRKADEIDKELATNFEFNSGNFIKAGLPLTFEGLNIDNRTAQAITLQLEETKIELQNTQKKLRESSIIIDQLHEELERTSSESTNSTVDPESVSDIIDQLINKGKLGSSVLISTNLYLELVLNQLCPMCGDKEITSRKHTIKVVGLSIHITIICSNCGTQINYNNETNGMDFSKAVAAAGLVGGMNREEIRTILSLIGLTRQNGIKQYFDNQDLFMAELIEIANKNAEQNLRTVCELIQSQGKYILEASFDCSWSHVREAMQASGEFVFNGIIENCSHKPIIAFHVVEKPREYKNKNEKTIIINKGNYNSSSKQMEHAILITIIDKITPILEEYNIVLDIAIDGDLDSNKTLANQSIVHRIFGDLKHKSKLIRKKIVNHVKWKQFEQPIMKYYSKCVYTAITRTANSDTKSPTDNELFDMQLKQ